MLSAVRLRCMWNSVSNSDSKTYKRTTMIASHCMSPTNKQKIKMFHCSLSLCVFHEQQTRHDDNESEKSQLNGNNQAIHIFEYWVAFELRTNVLQIFQINSHLHNVNVCIVKSRTTNAYLTLLVLVVVAFGVVFICLCAYFDVLVFVHKQATIMTKRSR